jgi:hypothetical protein
VNAHLTQSDDYEVSGGQRELEEHGEAGDRSSVGMKLGRLSFEDVSGKGTLFLFLIFFFVSGSERGSFEC